jgi:hypothetical protein
MLKTTSLLAIVVVPWTNGRSRFYYCACVPGRNPSAERAEPT